MTNTCIVLHGIGKEKRKELIRKIRPAHINFYGSTKIVIVLMAIFLSSTITAFACRCKAPIVSQAAKEAPEIFVGEVSVMDAGTGISTITFRTQQVFKGNVKDRMVVLTGHGNGDCGYPFEIGKIYLVYTVRPVGSKQTSLFPATNICTRTNALTAAEEDLRFLRQFVRPDRITRKK